MVGLYGLASLSWMTLLLLKRPGKDIPVITTITRMLVLISRTTVVIHTLRQSGPDSSNELIKIRCTSLTGKSQESPRTTIQKGTSTHQDTSLKEEILLAQTMTIVLATVLEGAQFLDKTTQALSIQELAIVVTWLRLNPFSMAMRSL